MNMLELKRSKLFYILRCLLMLKYFYIILFSITAFSQNNFDYSFTNPLIVSNDSELGLNRPRIVVDQVGNPVIIWTSFSENKLFISRKIENTFS